MTDLEYLLSIYDKLIKQFVKDMEGEYSITIRLDENFLRTCRQRIIEGHEKYGNDWKTKNCIKEIEYEKYDVVNYLLLDACQKHEKHLT